MTDKLKADYYHSTIHLSTVLEKTQYLEHPMNFKHI